VLEVILPGAREVLAGRARLIAVRLFEHGAPNAAAVMGFAEWVEAQHIHHDQLVRLGDTTPTAGGREWPTAPTLALISLHEDDSDDGHLILAGRIIEIETAAAIDAEWDTR
jgi:hypothetical protein